jgi:hypothetical protein
VRASGFALVLGLFLATGCGDDQAEPLIAPSPCDDLPRVETSEAPSPLTLQELNPALIDAADRMALALPEGRAREELRTTLYGLARQNRSGDAACNLFLASQQVMAQLDGLNDAASHPDREAIRLVLDLTLASLDGT